MPRFRDRREAGERLAAELVHYRSRPDVIVLGLPRGGVPVAFEVARALSVPLDVFIVRKLGVPWQPELAMGAVAGDGVEVLNADIIDALAIPEHVVRAVAEREREELERRAREYRGDRAPLRLAGQTVVLVDDGLATGSSMRAAVLAVRQQEARAVVVAVPVAAAATRIALAREVDQVVCVFTPDDFAAVGLWYVDFTQTTDEEVRLLLAQSSRQTPAPSEAEEGPPEAGRQALEAGERLSIDAPGAVEPKVVH